MYSVLVYIAILALGAAFVLALLSKWGIVERMQLHAPSAFLHQLVSCHLCLTWWTAVLLGAVLAVCTMDWLAVLAIPLSVPIGMRLW